MNKIFDTHCHPYLNNTKSQNEVIQSFFQKWWTYMTIVWTNIETSKKSILLSEGYEWVYCSIWIHPCDVYDLDLNNTLQQLEELILKWNNKIVAIWECWLDYYWLYKDDSISELDIESKNKIIESKKKIQKDFFKAQIILAKKYKLPIIIHNRNSKDDILEILKELNFKNFIFHCYSENLEYANKLINFSPNCKISFSGIITFKSAPDIQETAKNIDIKHILAETDSPYLTPTPYRWKEENEPIYIEFIIKKINELRWEDCSNEIFKNSINIFWLKK